MTKEQAQALCESAKQAGLCWFAGHNNITKTAMVVPERGRAITTYIAGLAKLARDARAAEYARTGAQWA